MNSFLINKTDMMSAFKGKLMLLCLVILVVTGLPVVAQNYSHPNISGPSGLQVNSYSGNLFYQRNDLMIPGRGLSVNIGFSYNSNDRDKDQGFGYGWNLNYNEFYKDSTGGLIFYRSDGRKDFFRFAGLGFANPKGVFDILSRDGAGKYVLRAKDGTQYFFESPSTKKLTRIRERNGNEIILTYAGNNLTTITDASLRTVTLSWNGSHLQAISSSASLPAKTVKYSYNDAACLEQVRDPAGYTIKYRYGPGRVMTNLTDGTGNESAIIYNSNSAVVKLNSCLAEKSILYRKSEKRTYVTDRTDSKTEQTTYSFDDEGKLISRTGNCCGYSTSYGYDGSNNITRITDGNGRSTLYGYDGRGNLLAETDPFGRTIRYTYEANYNQVTGVTDKNGNKTIFKYDVRGNLREKDYPLGIVLTYDYDDKGNRVAFTDGRGNTTAYVYNEYGYITAQRDAAGNTISFIWDGWGNKLSETDERKNTTAYSYDALDRLRSETDALKGVTVYEYDANSNTTEKTDANGNKTVYSYDPYDKLVYIKDALDNITSMTYDGLGNMTSSTDAAGHTSLYSYDNMNRLVLYVNAAGERTSYSYDGAGNRVTTSYPNGNTVRTEYDALNRINKMSDGLGVIVAFTYDANGNKLTEINGIGNTVTYKYDALDRLTAKTDADGNAYGYVYDQNNNLVNETDRKGNATGYRYDVLNRLQDKTDALLSKTTYTYDKAGNPESVTDANGNKTSYTYDVLNRKVQEKFADNSTRSFTYDKVGNLTGRKDNKGQLTKYQYDKINRLSYRVYPSATDSFTYDRDGKVLTANNKDAKVSFRYDIADRVSSETLNGKITRYSYDIAAGIKTITYPGGRVIQREIDDRNRLKTIRENGAKVLAEFAYNTAGQNTERKFANGTSNVLLYNNRGQVKEFGYLPSHQGDEAYSYDKEENPATASGTKQLALTGRFNYDATNQLTGFAKNDRQESYTYDKVNNRKAAVINGVNVSYLVNSMNAYSKIVYGAKTITPVYDGNGNLTYDGEKNYAYDDENRIVSVNNGAIARYVFDATGRRIKKITAAETVNYFFDGLQVVEERNSKDSITASYVWGTWVDDIVVMYRNKNSYYYNKNIVGSVLSVTDSSGAIVERYQYEGFGKFLIYGKDGKLLPKSAILNIYAFAGKEYDSETGLYFFRARFYDPVNGRFLQRDPIGYRDGLSLYAYVKNGPLAIIDAFGMEGQSWCLTLDDIQTILDILGMIPVFGEPFDLLNGTIYLARGDYINAALSLGSAVPIAGWALTGTKFLLKFGDKSLVGGKLLAKELNELNKAKGNIVDLGEWGEKKLASVLNNSGIKPSSPFTTSIGKRYVDRLVDGVAHEAKAGLNVKLTSKLEKQIQKDAELISNGDIKAVHWHFFQGADKSIIEFLEKNGINYTVY